MAQQSTSFLQSTHLTHYTAWGCVSGAAFFHCYHISGGGVHMIMDVCTIPRNLCISSDVVQLGEERKPETGSLYCWDDSAFFFLFVV